jgi:hypothetical protein
MQCSLTGLFFLSGAVTLASCSQSSERFTDYKAMPTDKVARFRVQAGAKFGYIDETGRVTIPPKFGGASRFSEGLAAVQVSDPVQGKWGYIDQAGRFAINRLF